MAQQQQQRRRFDCRLLPHGGYTLLPATLSTMAWIASLAQDGCDYATLSGPIVAELTDSSIGFPFLEVGFNAFRPPLPRDDGTWRADYTSKCVEYDPDVVTMDGYWTAAKAFEFISLVFGGGGALFLWFSSCFVFSPATWRWAGYEVTIAFLSQSLAFLWFRTSMCRGDGDRCSLFFGSKSDVAAAVFWFLSAVAIFARYPPPHPKGRGGETRSGRPAPEVVSATTGEAGERRAGDRGRGALVEEERRPGSEEEEEDMAMGALDAAAAELELPVEGDAGATLPPPVHDPGASGNGDKLNDSEIV